MDEHRRDSRPLPGQARDGTTEDFPFDETTLVFRVMNKMFALTGLEGDPPYVNLKCDPEWAIELRE